MEVHGQEIIWVKGQNCFVDMPSPANGSYFGTEAACEVQAACTIGSPLLALEAYAWTTLVCPYHDVENNAEGSWNQVNTINAWAGTLDLYNGMTRGRGFAQESCMGAQI